MRSLVNSPGRAVLDSGCGSGIPAPAKKEQNCFRFASGSKSSDCVVETPICVAECPM